MTASSGELPIDPSIFLLLFLLVFPLFWIAITGVIASQGWRAVAAAYPATSDAPLSARRVRFGSLRVGGRLMAPNYSSCIDGWFAQTGFWLRPFLLFRPFHPMIFVPWTQVESIEDERKLLTNFVRVRLSGNAPDLFFLGALGQAVRERR